MVISSIAVPHRLLVDGCQHISYHGVQSRNFLEKLEATCSDKSRRSKSTLGVSMNLSLGVHVASEMSTLEGLVSNYEMSRKLADLSCVGYKQESLEKTPDMSSYISQWESTEPAPFTREALLGVLDGKVGCIKEPHFVSPEVVQKIEEELSPKLSPYQDIPGPTLHRVGVAQFEFQAISNDQLKQRSSTGEEKLRYFEVADSHASLHEDLKQKIGLNIWRAVIDKIVALLPEYDVAVAEEGGRKYFSGIFRAINNSTPIHCDWSPYDSRTEDWIINQVTKQAVFNMYFTNPKGGKTEVHDCQWTEDALDWRDFSSYGYSEDLVKGRKKVIIQPKPADLCIFNSRNMHQVFPVEPEEDGTQRPRLTLSSFMGLIPSKAPGERPKLILWS